MCAKKILICLLIVLLKGTKCRATELCTRLVRVTAYSRGAKCAWGCKPEPGIIAVSRDLEKEGLTCGTTVYIEDLVYVVGDRMAFHKKNHVDIYMKKRAKKFGKKRLKIFWYKRNGGRRKHNRRRRF